MLEYCRNQVKYYGNSFIDIISCNDRFSTITEQQG